MTYALGKFDVGDAAYARERTWGDAAVREAMVRGDANGRWR